MIAKFLALSTAASAAYKHAGDGWWLEIGGGANK